MIFTTGQAENGGGFTAEVSEEDWKKEEKSLRNVKILKSC